MTTLKIIINTDDDTLTAVETDLARDSIRYVEGFESWKDLIKPLMRHFDDYTRIEVIIERR